MPRPSNRSGIKCRARQEDLPKLPIESQKVLGIPFNVIQELQDGSCYVKVWGTQKWETQGMLNSLRFIIYGFHTNKGPAIFLMTQIELQPFEAGVESEIFNRLQLSSRHDEHLCYLLVTAKRQCGIMANNVNTRITLSGFIFPVLPPYQVYNIGQIN